MIAGFETNTATFYAEEQTGVETDPYGEEEPIYEWVAQYTDVPVRVEQQGAEYVREVYGEWPEEVYRLYVDPHTIGDEIEETETDGDGNEVVVGHSYELGISANDRVEISGVTGTFSLQPPNLRGLDSEVPEVVQLEVTRVSV